MSQDQRSSLTSALRAVAEADALTMRTSTAVEALLREQVRAIRRTRRRRMYTTAAGLAAALIVAALLPRWLDAPLLLPPPAADQMIATETLPPVETATEFFPLTYSAASGATGQIVRLEVPRRALASFGLVPLEGRDTDRAGTVLADVFVSDDGLARAVRFVRVQKQ